LSVVSHTPRNAPSAAKPRVLATVEPLFVTLVSIGLLVVIRLYSIDFVGGSDSYGYLSEAIRLLHGHLYEAEHVFGQFGLPENPWLTFPLGYRPFGSQGLVPTYPFGYPLLMAIAMRGFGFAAAFWVDPVLAVGTVLLTYLTGRRLLGRLGGVLAASLVAILPNFLWSSFQVMSDVPATFFAILALYALLSPNRSIKMVAVVAAAEGLAIWIRPNLALITVPTGLWFVGQRDWRRLVAFGVLLVPFVGVEGAVNTYLYGAPWATGYGQADLTHSLADVGQRAVRYLLRLQDQQAGIGLFLVAAGVVVGRLSWPIRALLLATAGLFFVFFSFYRIDDAWWYARFLLPGFPAVALLEASILVRLVEVARYRWIGSGILAVGAALFGYGSVLYSGGHDVFDQAAGARGFLTSAEFARAQVQQPAVVLAMQVSGSVRLYGGLESARYDLGTPRELIQTLGEVQAAGGHIYLLAYPWEITNIQKGDRAILLAGAQKVGQVEPGPVLLYRLDPPLLAGDERPGHSTRITFPDATGSAIRLDGYSVSSTTVRPGATLMVTLDWEATGQIGQDYSVFIHVVDQSGKIVAQSDSYPENNRYPTSKWQIGYVVADSHAIAIPDTTPAATYQIQAGLYQYQTLKRLQPNDQNGPLKTDYVPLGTVQVAQEK